MELPKRKHPMKNNLRKTALVDSCFWFALFMENDQYNKEARKKEDDLFRLQYIIPWPTLYETLCTKFVKKPERIQRFESFLKRPNAILLDDSNYKVEALSAMFSMSRRGQSSCSLVDNILRMIIEDTNVRVEIFTFNQRDFLDICRKNKVELIS
jgi:predicted nucleic acid-binding protein